MISLSRARIVRLIRTKQCTNERQHGQQARIPDGIEHPVAFLARQQQTTIAQQLQMLGDIRLGTSERLVDVLHTGRPLTEKAENAQTHGMPHGLDDARGMGDVGFGKFHALPYSALPF